MSEIFHALELNTSAFWQLGVCFAFFFIAKHTFFEKLKFVVTNRLDNTTDLEAKAEDQFTEAKELAEKYKNKIDEVYQEAQATVTAEKDAASKKCLGKIHTAEKEASDYISEKRVEINAEVDKYKSETTSQTSALSKELVNKVLG